MKNITLLFTIALFSCTSEEVTDDIETSIDDNIIEINTVELTPLEKLNAGESSEYYPNDALKIKGNLDENGERNGLWISYYDNGSKWSESYYVRGKRDGHTLTFFPNGQVRYIGEYKEGDKIGIWKFYDEEGNVVKEETF